MTDNFPGYDGSFLTPPTLDITGTKVVPGETTLTEEAVFDTLLQVLGESRHEVDAIHVHPFIFAWAKSCGVLDKSNCFWGLKDNEILKCTIPPLIPVEVGTLERDDIYLSNFVRKGQTLAVLRTREPKNRPY